MFFKNFRGKLFENAKRYAKLNLRQRYRKPARRGFQIISYMFNLNVKQALANQICCTQNMCIITQNDRKCQNASKCLLRNGTESNDTSSYIFLDHSNAFNLSGGILLSRTSLPEPIFSGKGGWIFNYSPCWGPLAFWQDQTGTCTTWLWGLQYKAIIGSLWYLATEAMR